MRLFVNHFTALSNTHWVKCGRLLIILQHCPTRIGSNAVVLLIILQRCIEHTVGQMRLFVNHFTALSNTHWVKCGGLLMILQSSI
jgi:hypothetical protein